MLIVKVPGINGLGKTSGCRDAGRAVIEKLREIHSSESGKEMKDLRFEEIHVDNSNLEKQNDLIYKNAFDVFKEEEFTVFLGGDHSVSYPLARAFLDYCEVGVEGLAREPCLIVFDAHADCMEPMKEPTHEEWLRGLIEKGFPAKNILLVGVRNMWKTESSFLKENGIRTISMNRLLLDIEDSCDIIMEFAKDKQLYVSLDIDVADPAFAPATGYCEPGGLTSRQLIYLVQRLRKVKGLRAFDIVEINSEKDSSGITTKLGAKILGELV